MVTPAAIVLLVQDHRDHDVGNSENALDKKDRVDWAWRAVQEHSAVKLNHVSALALNVQRGTVNGSSRGAQALALRRATKTTKRLLPLLAQSWDPAAPTTLSGNLAEKLGSFERLKNIVMDMNDGLSTVADECCLPMTSLKGAKRATRAMLVAAVFAAELSSKERVPVLVLGRPPGHHATCAHRLDLLAKNVSTPGGDVDGRSMGGGCFYPSCWLAAVHCLREGYAKRLAYIDVDAHKPDGVWKEIEHLRSLDEEPRSRLLGNGTCEGALFASVHLDGYPRDPKCKWISSRCTLPSGPRKAFDVRVLEQLLPRGLDDDGKTPNEKLLCSYDRWQKRLSASLPRFQPDAVFVGLGLDLHVAEKEIGDKRQGVGVEAQHYRELLAGLEARGPVVLTLEGGYTRESVSDGIRGALVGLVEFSRRRGWRPKRGAATQHHRIPGKVRALVAQVQVGYARPCKKGRFCSCRT